MNNKKIGFFGERIAVKYLKDKGYQILDKNYSFRIPGNPQKGEIDIVARKFDTISFVEVKTLVNQKSKTERWAVGGWRPEEKINFGKQKKLIKTAESWLMAKKIPLNTQWQIDVISVMIDEGKAKIWHFENAISYSY
jgi:putative endonuclease